MLVLLCVCVYVLCMFVYVCVRVVIPGHIHTSYGVCGRISRRWSVRQEKRHYTGFVVAAVIRVAYAQLLLWCLEVGYIPACLVKFDANLFRVLGHTSQRQRDLFTDRYRYCRRHDRRGTRMKCM